MTVVASTSTGTHPSTHTGRASARLSQCWGRLSLCCAILWACSSCDFDRDQSAAEQLVRAKPLPGGRGTKAALRETEQHSETTAVIKSEAAWDSLWRRVGRPPTPSIDFTREMLVAAGIGMGSWARDLSIRLSGARADSLVAIIHVRDGIPELCALNGRRAPMAVLRIERDPRPVAFRWEYEDLRCGHGK